jgi:hypothetical protein
VLVALVIGRLLAQSDLIGTATVIDGDTIEIRGERTRLHGIDVNAAEECPFFAEIRCPPIADKLSGNQSV